MIKTFEELKNTIEGKMLTFEDFQNKYEDLSFVAYQNNDYSGNYIDSTWWTATDVETKDEFDFYTVE